MVDALINRAAELRVGGTYWAAQPQLPEGRYTLIATRDVRVSEDAVASASGEVFVADPGSADPWHLAGNAASAIVDADDELALIAATAGVPVRCAGEGRFKTLENGGRAALREAFREVALDGYHYVDPFTGDTIDQADGVDLCSFWRQLIDCNRGLTAVLGLAFWKRDTVAPLLWGGSETVPFVSERRTFDQGDRVAVWKSRTSSQALERLEASGANIVEVEDGFIRSVGLGADCVPPLSIVVDPVGIYFDPEHPSALESFLQDGVFDGKLVGRARQLREIIVAQSISKYGSGGAPMERRTTGKRHLLVPGQVEDDRSIISGGGNITSNLELLRRVRERAGDAYIMYKPHPDVEAGHRVGAIPDDIILTIADEVIRDVPIPSLIAMVDEVHVNTSLAGFEALLRHKPVTTYGVPFFAGWGLTTDLGHVPRRRTARRTLDELVAASLLLYPRYLDPVSGLPCPAEILLQRLSGGGSTKREGMLVRLRRLQGQLRRAARALRSGRRL